MKFTGREAELHELHAAWERASNGIPQAVVLIGESRMGKTRIVQEFFQRLSLSEDPSGYWPDALDSAGDNLQLNPPLRDAATVVPCPWLWWAVRWTAPNSRNRALVEDCAALAGASELRPHVAAAERLRRVRAAERNAAIGAGKTLLNLATMGTAGTAIEIFERFQDWWTVRQAAAPSASAVSAHREQAITSRLAELRELLHTFSSPGLVTAEGTPLILVLDDAQWADADTLNLCTQLLGDCSKHRPRTKQPPARMLIVATCWEQEWNRQVDQARNANAAATSSLAACLTAATARGDVESSELRLARISDSAGVELLREALPGLTDQQTSLVLGRAGGSPGLLWEIVQMLKRSRHLFAKSDTSGMLTAGGERAVRDKNVAYHSLVEERLAAIEDDDPLGVASLLRLASYLGMVFSAPVLAALRERLPPAAEAVGNLDDQPHALARAESPLALIQSLVAKLHEFRLPVYREVLEKQLRDSDDLLASVRDAVLVLIEEFLTGAALAELTEPERDVFLSFAADELRARMAAGDDALRVQWLALVAEQLNVLEDSGRTAALRTLVDRWFEIWRADRELPELLLRNSRILSVMRTAELAERSAEVIELGQALQHSESTSSSDAISDSSWFEIRLIEASAQSNLGRSESSINTLESILAIAEERLVSEPDVALHWYHVNRAANGLAAAVNRTSDWRRTGRYSLRALETSREVLTRWGPTQARRELLAADALNVAMHGIDEVKQGWLEQQEISSALPFIEESLEQIEACRQEAGDSASLMMLHSQALSALADVLLRDGDLEGAQERDRQSIRGFEQIIERYGESADRLLDLSQRQTHFAQDLLTQREQVDDEMLNLGLQAWMHAVRARDVYGETPRRLIHAANAGNVYIQLLLEWDRAQQGSELETTVPTAPILDQVSGIADDVLYCSRRALEIDDDNPERLDDLCRALGRVFNCFSFRGERQAGRPLLEEMAAVADRLHALDPRSEGAAHGANARDVLAKMDAAATSASRGSRSTH